jgi:biofilm PGA synthesis N-glycosyltransferase PgaC
LSYWVAVVARNAAPHLRSTLDSLLNQTLKPSRITIVNDGSTDETREILSDYQRRQESCIKVLTLPNRGYDIRRVPSNINLAWKETAAQGLETDYFMISGDDCFYPARYVESLVLRMETDKRVAVASGRPSANLRPSREQAPSGSGRMIRTQFWREIGSRYPVKAGWEAWLLFAAAEKGLKVKVFPNVIFDHRRPTGAAHHFIYWGAAMQTLGYHPFYALGRIAISAIKPTLVPERSINMLRGYLLAKLGSDDCFISPFDSSLRSFVRLQQVRRISNIVVSLGGRR